MNEKDKIIDTLKSEIESYKAKYNQLKRNVEENGNLKMTIFSNLSHELRTPLNGIIGFSEILGSAQVSSDELKLYTNVIEESSVMLMSILNDAFDISRIETGNFKIQNTEFDLNNVLFKIFMHFKSLAEAKNLQIFLENLISEQFIVNSDPVVIERILMKLIDNAIKFTKQGWIKVFYEVQGFEIKFIVEDTGIGISEDNRANLFTRFVSEDVSKSRKVSGTGIDLTLCNGLVKLLGGEITYTQKSTQGSIFQFTFSNIPTEQ